MSEDDDEVESTLAALRQHYWDRLTEWEQGFVGSVERQHEERGSLTDRQIEKLSEVFERVTRSGRDGGSSYQSRHW